ncbi:MAG: TatD family hydrolase [Caldisphaeraceae archaeon]|nr:TatD family hydrolase [Caldisphaeraceae archaeon]MEB3692161.1 TatD family hydrolase [Caldisphaeraceae archaeon]MEB3797944.1 TatD family hydrolase [Caldisphaeraceae archaeon]
MKIKFADAHSHINPIKGLGHKIAEKFKDNSGWFIAFVSLSPWDYFDEFQGFISYKKMIDAELRECKKSEEIGIKTVCLAGFHPGDIDYIINKYNKDASYVLDLATRVIDYEASLCSKGELHGIGEVGRQHYKTMPERVAISEIILEKALEYAKDLDIVVHMHLENANRLTVDIIDYVVNRIGIKDKKKIIFHHAKPSMIPHIHDLGYSATLYGIEPVLEESFKSLPPVYMIESDYPDDERGKSLVAPWELPTKLIDLSKKYGIDEDYLHRINVENIKSAYRL